MSDKRWMEKLKKGGLHRALGVPEGQPIPESKMKKAAHSRSGHVKKMVQAAKNMEKSNPNIK